MKLLKFEEALEERIESSHFSPPLSKQRIEYARTMINALEAKTLVLRATTYRLLAFEIIHTCFEHFSIILCLLIISASALHDVRQVDLGCGSGSLLEALLKEPNTLEHMIGIDISRKALIRGAKVYIPPF